MGTANIFVNQNDVLFVEILDLAHFDAPNGLLPCCNRDKALSPENCDVNQSQGIGLDWRSFPLDIATGKYFCHID